MRISEKTKIIAVLDEDGDWIEVPDDLAAEMQ